MVERSPLFAYLAPHDGTDDGIRGLTPGWKILWISVLGLYLELLIIRWIGTEIRIFAYLQNTVLVVCFLGLGLRFMSSRDPIRPRRRHVRDGGSRGRGPSRSGTRGW